MNVVIHMSHDGPRMGRNANSVLGEDVCSSSNNYMPIMTCRHRLETQKNKERNES